MAKRPTGQQYLISSGRYQAIITEVGATLRSLQVDGAEWLWSFAADAIPAGSQGRQLLPWPNRIADGRYQFQGQQLQLNITEPARNTALHGLNAGLAWELVSHSDTEVVQSHTFYPQAGWNGILTAQISHQVSADGLRVTISVKNDGASDLPYGYGVHPYFQFDSVDEVELLLPFEQELLVDPIRLLPLSLSPITAEHDFREPRRLERIEFDTAFTAASSPSWRLELRGDGRLVQIWADETLPWVQLYTARSSHQAIAVEPMSCGPNAFNQGPTHQGLIVLAPGQTSTSVWGVRAG